MTPAQLDRAIAVARQRYAAMTPADFRRGRCAERRERLYAAVRRVLSL